MDFVMKRKVLKITGAAAGAALTYMAFGLSFFEMMVHSKAVPDKKTMENRKKWFQLPHIKINHPRHGYEKEYEEGKAWCREQDMQDCYIESLDGLKLHASFLPAKNARRNVILSHGYKGSGFGDFANTAQFLHENNCNLLFIDQRCCGQSEGEYITFGAMEQYDVQRWAYYVAARNKRKLPIYLYGESMGATTILLASGNKLPKEVRGFIADCGFSSMKGQFQDMAANWFHLHWVQLLILRLNLFCRLFAGFAMEESDTAKAMRVNKKPVLFFHGSEDTYVSPTNTLRNYSMCRARKELVIVPGARHLCSPYVNPKLYRRKLLRFFAEFDG